MDITEFIIITLAIWRIANLFTDQAEPGPFEIFHKFREFIGIRFDENNIARAQNELAKIFTCIWCLSVWLGLVWTISFYLIPGMTIWISIPFAISAGTIIVREKLT